MMLDIQRAEPALLPHRDRNEIAYLMVGTTVGVSVGREASVSGTSVVGGGAVAVKIAGVGA